jgi:hypothetical protein
MNELELRLAELGRELAFPREPDVGPAVVARLEGRRPFPWQRVALACALLAVALGAAFAVPQARTAILRFFDLGAARVERVDTLPPAVERSQATGLGRPLPLREAERVVGFRLALPSVRPARAYVFDAELASVLLRAHGRTVLLSELRSSDQLLLKKMVSDATFVEPQRVGSSNGLWIAGAPHTLTYVGRNGFHQSTILVRGNVLLWVRGTLTLRLEGKLTKAQALELARSIR